MGKKKHKVFSNTFNCIEILQVGVTLTAHRTSLSDGHSHLESVKMTTVKEVGLYRADETKTASSRRRPLIMTPSMEEAEDAAKLWVYDNIASQMFRNLNGLVFSFNICLSICEVSFFALVFQVSFQTKFCLKASISHFFDNLNNRVWRVFLHNTANLFDKANLTNW